MVFYVLPIHQFLSFYRPLYHSQEPVNRHVLFWSGHVFLQNQQALERNVLRAHLALCVMALCFCPSAVWRGHGPELSHNYRGLHDTQWQGQRGSLHLVYCAEKLLLFFLLSQVCSMTADCDKIHVCVMAPASLSHINYPLPPGLVVQMAAL